MTDTEAKENEGLQEKLSAAAAALGEHFESVLILATTSGGDAGERQGVLFQASSGSVYASQGAARSYVDKRKGYDEAAGFDLYHFHNPDDDEGDEE